MGNIKCRGRICVDEETGATFFLPDPECSPKDYAKVKEISAEKGIALIEPNKPKPKNVKK